MAASPAANHSESLRGPAHWTSRATRNGAADACGSWTMNWTNGSGRGNTRSESGDGGTEGIELGLGSAGMERDRIGTVRGGGGKHIRQMCNRGML